jgi:hypothetical protein
MFDLFLASAIGFQSPAPIILTQNSPNWRVITNAKYHQFRRMVLDPNPGDSVGARVSQQQVSTLFGSPISCDGDTYMRFCVWEEKRGAYYRKVSVTWRVSDKTVISWDASGDLPY